MVGDSVDLKEYFEKQVSHLHEIFTQGRDEIRRYFDGCIAEQARSSAVTEQKLQRYFDLRIDALEKALEVFREFIDARFKEVNEFRNALKDVIEFQASTKSLEGAVKGLEAQNDHLKELLGTKADREKVDAQIAAIQESISQLEKYKAAMEGKASQTSVLIALAFSLIGVVLTIINMFR